MGALYGWGSVIAALLYALANKFGFVEFGPVIDALIPILTGSTGALVLHRSTPPGPKA